jgi:hypothetical protein
MPKTGHGASIMIGHQWKIFAALSSALFLTPALISQQSGYNETGPVPSAISTAKTIFVANAGADSGLFPEPFSGDQNRPYTEFYFDLKASGKYELVGDPAQADLVLEIQLIAPPGPSSGSKVNGASDPLPMFRLVIYERKSHYLLWAITESVRVAYLQKTHDLNFDQAIAALVSDFERVSGKLPVGTP